MKQPNKSIEDRDKLINQWLGLPKFVYNKQIANHPVVRCVGEEEALSLGYMGLIRAAELYDPERVPKVKFNTYAIAAIRNYVIQHARDQVSLIRVPANHFNRKQPPGRREKFKKYIDAAMSCGTLCGEDSCDGEGLSFGEVNWDEDREVLNEIGRLNVSLNKLPERYSLVLKRRFYEGKIFSAIAKELGCTREYARQLQNKALRKLKEEVKCST